MIKDIKDIPSLPQVTIELVRHTFTEEPDIQQVASIVERDPTLTAKLFKTVNSAAFGLKVEIKSVRQAISLLGLDSLRSTIISIAMGDYFVKSFSGKALDLKQYCIHSLATAVLMQLIAQAKGIKKSQQLYLLGLLHDLGKIALDHLPNSDYGQVLDRVKEGKSFEEAEREIYGWDNQQVWQLLARTWGFPPQLLSLYRGWLEGKTRIPTRRFIEDASMLAETLGHYFIQPVDHNNATKFEIIEDIDENTLADICQNVQCQVEVIGKILDCPQPGTKEIYKTLFYMFQRLANANSKFTKTHHELQLKVEVLEELTQVFTGIIKCLQSEGVTCSTLEALVEGFHIDGAFLLSTTSKKDLQGHVVLRIDQQKGMRVQALQVAMHQLSPVMKECIEYRVPTKVNSPSEDPILKRILAGMGFVWLSPIFVRGRFSSILGLGIADKANPKFDGDDFRRILEIVSGEVGLSMENSRLFKTVQEEAKTDSLTNISNRRTIIKVLTSEFSRFKRDRIPLTVAVFDLDHFKSINDSRGHLVGDEFLIKTAGILQDELRSSDYIGRYGGDEFLAIFPDTSAEDVCVITERIREKLLEFCAEFEGPDMDKKLSVSIGVASADEKLVRFDELIQLADNALYKAKVSGRNQCVVSECMTTTE
jgi:diguanylate cyclase (GGDEF)-like protein